MITLQDLRNHPNRERHDQLDDSSLNVWIEELTAITDQASRESAELPLALNDLGNALRSRFRRSGAPGDIDASIGAHAEAVRLAKDEGERAGLLTNLAGSLQTRYGASESKDDLDRAIDAYQEAVEIHPNDTRFLNNVGNGLLARYQAGGDPRDLSASAEAYQAAVKNAEDGSLGRAGCLGNLGRALGMRYSRFGDLADLDWAISELEESVRVWAISRTETPPHLENLAHALLLRHSRTRESNDLQRAIDMATTLVDATPPGSPSRARRLEELAFMLGRRSEAGDDQDLDRSIDLLREALTESPPPLLLASVRDALGTAYRTRHYRTGSLQDLKQSLESCKEAVYLTPQRVPPRAARLSHLAVAAALRHAALGMPEDRYEAIKAYRESSRLALEVQPEVALANSHVWGGWAAIRGSTKEAAEAYGYGLQAMQLLFQGQLTRAHKETWLTEARGLPIRAGFARARAGDPQGAIEALEGGRALLLSEALERDRADLARLVEAGRADLKERYEVVATRWSQMSAPQPAPSPAGEEQTLAGEVLGDDLREAKEELDASIEAIREVPGYERFLLPPTFSDVLADAGENPLVYLGATESGGLALIVFPAEGSVEPVWLPDLTEDALAERVRSYRNAYRTYLDSPRTRKDRLPWEGALEEVTAWAWNVVMGEVLTVLGQAPHATLVPAGLLGVLPLHASWTPDPSAPTGRRYALDGITLTYAPNARALAAAREVWEKAEGEHLVAVDEPDLGARARARALGGAADRHSVSPRKKGRGCARPFF